MCLLGRNHQALFGGNSSELKTKQTNIKQYIYILIYKCFGKIHLTTCVFFLTPYLYWAVKFARDEIKEIAQGISRFKAK
jgi:hypothetical protein